MDAIPTPIAKAACPLVVVIHGFSGKRLGMFSLCARLRSRNFRVASWGYPSLIGSIERHAANLYRYLTESLSQESPIHIIAHSMGSIIVRSALTIGTIPNLHRIVLLAPPNRGTPMARFAAPFLGRICQPIADLSDHQDSFVNTIPESSPVDIAVVAARFDLLVPVANTHLASERDHVVLNATHNSLLISPTAATLACSFLTTGRFH